MANLVVNDEAALRRKKATAFVLGPAEDDPAGSRRWFEAGRMTCVDLNSDFDGESFFNHFWIKVLSFSSDCWLSLRTQRTELRFAVAKI